MADTSLNTRLVLLVEGNDEAFIYRSIINNLKVDEIHETSKSSMKSETCTIFSINGGGIETNIPNAINLISPKVERIGLVLDAEADYAVRFASVQRALKKSGLSAPSGANVWRQSTLRKANVCVGVFLQPGDGLNGTLEDLCLDCVSSHPIMPCVEELVQCVSQHMTVANEKKARMQSFLAFACRELYAQIGRGIRDGVFDFNKPGWTSAKEFITALYSNRCD